MALDDFKTEEKTSSPSKSTEGPSEGGVNEFIKKSQEETQKVAGGFEISNDNSTNYDTEVIKIFGGPGTGKTTTMVGNTDIEDFQGILHYMFENYNPKELMLIAYTRAAADEAKERLVKLTSHSENKLGKRITTIHSLAMQKQGLRPKDIVEIRYVPDKYNFCRQAGLQYAKNESSDPSEMMAEPTDEGHLFFDMLSWLKSSLKPLDEAVDCPLFSEWTHTVEQFEEWGQEWDAYKKEKGIWEFDDAILECVNENAKVDAKYLFVDEVQDLYPLQQAFLDNQFGTVKRIFLAGDDDQCLPPTAPVELRNEHGSVVRKEIQDVEVGDRVQSMYGGGDYGYREVTDVTVKDVVNKRFKTFTTESGKELTVTDNHKLFTRIPEADHDTKSDVHYVYLMRDDSGRWRIGETDNLHQRLNVERNARCIVPIEVCQSRDEALLKEAQYSLNYSIPTTSFTQRQGEVLSEESMKARLYDNIEMGLVALQNDLGVDLDRPPLFKKATTRGRTESLNLNITMCSDVRDSYIGHKFEVHTSNEEYVEELQTLDILNSTQRRGENWRFRKASSDLSMLGNLAEHIQEGLTGDVITQMKPTERRQNAYVVPAKNVVEGMLVPVIGDGKVVFEEVIEVTEFHDTTEVYDLTVKGTHNFSSNQIFCHNTIYEWAGAKPEYFLNMDGHVVDEMPELWGDKTGYWDNDGVYILDQSWRMPNEILRLAKMCIEQVSNRQEKRIKPHHEGGTFVPLRSPSAESVLKYVDFDDTYMLFRAKYQINNFTKKLIDEGIPYVDTRFVNTNYGGTWNSDIIKLRDGLRAIMRREDTMTGEQASRVIEELPRNALKDDRKTLMTTLGSRSEIPTQSLVDVVSYGWPSGSSGILKWCMEFEEANWYQENAVRNNLKEGHEDMYPDGFKLGTIHSSKGREAGTIILSLDSADPIMENMPPNGINDAERRLMYVGMTRTKDTLVMVEDLDAESPSFTIDEVLGPKWRDDYEFVQPELEGGALADD